MDDARSPMKAEVGVEGDLVADDADLLYLYR